MSHAADERQVLADALLEAGPEASTLCEGWTAHDLAAHLVSREHRVDAAAGARGGPFAPWTERVQSGYVRRPFADLVQAFRSGPPMLAWTGMPGVDARANLSEHFVHAEDVRRARPRWEPRTLSLDEERALWRQATGVARLRYRHAPVGVVLVVPDGPRKVVHRGARSVTLTGAPGELLLHVFGRGEHARVEVGGDSSAVEQFMLSRG